jgi:predicted RNA binding protein YcfA (HicA-like mRNA interferase family)
MQVQEILAILETDGWYIIEQHGSYRQYKHPHKKGRITIAANPNYDLEKDSINSILLQAGLLESFTKKAPVKIRTSPVEKRSI